MDIKIKWFYRLGFLLLLFIVIFTFIKLEPFWGPILDIILSVSLPFVISAFIAYLLHPLVEKLHDNGLQRWLSILLIYLLFFGGAGFAIYKAIPILIIQLKELSENIPVLVQQYDQWAVFIEERTKSWPLGIHAQIDEGFEAINVGMERLVERVLNTLLWIVDKFFLIVLIPFIAFYMIKDMDQLKKVFWQMVPEKKRQQARIVVQSVDQSLGNYIRGQLIVCGLIGTAAAFFFWIIKLHYPLLLGSIVGVTNVIPYFGPIIGAVPAVIIAATMSPKMVIFVGIIIFVLQFLEGNVLSPLIVGKSLQMHPLMIIFSILIGGEVGGVIGLILAVPTAAIIKTVIIQARILLRHKVNESTADSFDK